MRISFGIPVVMAALSLALGCTEEGGGRPQGTGSAGAGGSTGVAGTGSASAGTGVAGTGSASAGTGVAGAPAGTAGTGSAGTGTAGTGTAGTGTTTDGGAGAGANKDATTVSDVARDVVPAGGTSMSRHTKRPIGMPYAKNGYWEYLPPGYGDGTKRPLLVFWHGVGEDGSGSATDLNKVAIHGPPKNINMNKWPAEWPFIVLSPQHGPSGCPSATELHDFFTFAIGQYDVDTTRVYLTGLSCGARGGFAYLGMYKGEQIPAAVLIAGDSTAAYTAGGCDVVTQVALWVFHGGADNPTADQASMTKFMACPQPRKDVKFTLEPGADHVKSWELVYDDPAVMKMVVDWLLSFTKM